MRKGFFKSFAAVAMSVSMALGMTTMATASDVSNVTGSRAIFDITGEGGILDTVIRVSVPVDLAFAIDPSESSDSFFQLYNLTDKPVLVSFDLTVNAAENVSLVATPGALKNNLYGNDFAPTSTTGERAAYFGLYGAATIGTLPTLTANKGILSASMAQATVSEELFTFSFASVAQQTAPTFIVATSAGIKSNAGTSGQIKADFVLGQAVGGTGTRAEITAATKGESGIAAFQLTGAYTTGDVFNDGDLSVEGVYSFTVSSDTTYKKVTRSATKSEIYLGVNQLKLADNQRPAPGTASNNNYDVAITANRAATATLSRAALARRALESVATPGAPAPASTVLFKMVGNPASVSAVVNATMNFTLPTELYSYDQATGILTLPEPSANSVAYSVVTPLGTSAVQLNMVN